jgi:hypothetical protein
MGNESGFQFTEDSVPRAYDRVMVTTTIRTLGAASAR